METVLAIGIIVVLILVADRLLRTRFRQESPDTVGKASRLDRPDASRPLGEVIDDLTSDATRNDLPDGSDGPGSQGGKRG